MKFDFLGLKTLSVLKKAVQLLAKRGIDVDLDALEWDDRGRLRAAPDGRHGRRVPARIGRHAAHAAAVRPTNFGDIIALVSLYRPGPMDNIPMFGAPQERAGGDRLSAPAARRRSSTETYGIFVYQEQVMQAAQILAGYSLGGADLLRRAMGKKIKAEMDAQRASFVEGCAERSTRSPRPRRTSCST